MKRLLLWFLITLPLICNSQLFSRDSLTTELARANADTTRVLLLVALSQSLESGDLDSAIFFAREANALATKIRFEKGEAVSLNTLGRFLMKKGNFSRALQIELESLQTFEKLQNKQGIASAYNDIGNIYERLGDHEKALDNFRRAREAAIATKDASMLMLTVSSIGFNFYKLNKLDSALRYAQEAYDLTPIAAKNRDRLPWHIALLGGIHDKMGNTGIALAYYRDALTKATQNGQGDLLPYVYQVMAMLFRRTGQTDSAIYYAEKAFATSQKVQFTNGLVEGSSLLAELYAGRDNTRAVKYFKIATGLKDSIFSEEKVRQVQNVTFDETLRQQEIEKQKQLEFEERKKNLQFAAISIGLICFVIFFLVLSHSIIVNERIIRFLGVIGLLVVFEFINLLIHPFVGEVTHHSPFLMLVVMVIIAAMLVPAHHYLEKSITRRMVEKNKRIRLEAAKRLIEKLSEH